MNSQNLKEAGFVGWIPVLEAGRDSSVPDLPGIYAVIYAEGRPEKWPPTSCGGWHKGRDPVVPLDRLALEWVDGADIVYVGKAEQTLAKRLGELARFGAGEAVPHWGGRMIWQLPKVAALTVCWMPSPEKGGAGRDEVKLLQAFVAAHGRLPFANLRL